MLVLEMSCGEPPSVDNALPVGGNLYGDTVIYWCKDGFIQGPTNGSVVCQKNGKWSWNGGKITCKRKYYSVFITGLTIIFTV